jgi:hypothetical protein
MARRKRKLGLGRPTTTRSRLLSFHVWARPRQRRERLHHHHTTTPPPHHHHHQQAEQGGLQDNYHIFSQDKEDIELRPSCNGTNDETHSNYGDEDIDKTTHGSCLQGSTSSIGQVGLLTSNDDNTDPKESQEEVEIAQSAACASPDGALTTNVKRVPRGGGGAVNATENKNIDPFMESTTNTKIPKKREYDLAKPPFNLSFDECLEQISSKVRIIEAIAKAERDEDKTTLKQLESLIAEFLRLQYDHTMTTTQGSVTI